MSCTLTLMGLPEGDEHKTFYHAKFGWEKVAQGHCARNLEEINDVLRPNGIVIHRLDLRYQKKEMKKLIKDVTPDDENGLQRLRTEFILPRMAMQGLCISSFQHQAVEQTEYVHPNLGPFARLDDGGAIETKNEELGEFPKLLVVTPEIAESMGQPFLQFHNYAAEDDSSSTNNFTTVFHGNATWFGHLGHCIGLSQPFSGFWHPGMKPVERPQLPGVTAKIDFECDADNGWRIIHRGDVPTGFAILPGMKFVMQVIGPEKFKKVPFDEPNPFLQGLEG